MEACVKLHISKLFQRFIAAHEYFPTCSLLLLKYNSEIILKLLQRLKQLYFSFRRGYMWN